MIRNIYFSLICLLLLASSTACNQEKSQNQSLEGVWKSIGYGRILHIQGDSYTLYDETSLSCLPIHENYLSVFGDRLFSKNDTLFLKKGTGLYHFIKIAKLPMICTDTISEITKKDPEYNFEVFTETLEEHFAYFERNGVHWDSLYQESKSKIHSNTTDAELYLIMEDLITALQDNHGYIEAEEEVALAAEKLRQKTDPDSVSSNLREYGDFEVSQLAAAHFLKEELTRGTKLMQWGKTIDGGGYLTIKTMWLYADLELSDSLIKADGYVNTYADAFMQMNEGVYIEKERQGVASILDTVMKDLKNTNYLIIDVRFNGGGQDVVSMEILKRFNTERKKVALKKAVSTEAYTPLITINLASSKNAYLNPVYLLTSRQSGSATDFLALASLSIPHIKRIGTRTAGALSDALEKRLPNGWYFSVSNEIYTDLSGNCYESIGVPPNYTLNYPEDRQAFFRQIANDPETDQRNILNIIDEIRHEQ